MVDDRNVDHNNYLDPDVVDKDPDINSPVDLLVGEGRKFKSLDELAAAKIEADNFIEKLKKENRELREELKRRKGLVDLFEEVKKEEGYNEAPVSSSGDSMNTHANERAERDNQHNPASQTADNTFNLEEKIRETFEKLSFEEKAKQMEAQFVEQLAATYGDKTSEVFQRTVTEYGLSAQEIRDLLVKSPKLVQQMFKLSTKEEYKVSDSGVKGDTERVTPPVDISDDKTSSGASVLERLPLDVAIKEGAPESYWKALRRQNKAVYLTPRVQAAIYKSRMKLGDKYFNK